MKFWISSRGQVTRTIASIRDNLKALNAEAELVTAYPSEFESLLKERQVQQ